MEGDSAGADVVVLRCSGKSGLSEFGPARRGNMAARFPLCLLLVFVVTAHVTGAAPEEEEERGRLRTVLTEEGDSPRADSTADRGWLPHLSRMN